MKHIRFLTIVLALLVLGSTGFSARVSAADAPQAVVNTARLNVRQGPGTDYSVIGDLKSGDDVTVTGRNAAGSWYQVSLPSETTGWVSAGLVKMTGDASSRSDRDSRVEKGERFPGQRDRLPG
jgi:N-acetylmuramoyl-L-alanine amidase